jgi:hypothetical protein
LTSLEKEFTNTVDQIKNKHIALYQVIPRKDFTFAFLRELTSLSKKLEKEGLKDFRVRTSDGMTTIQPFGIGSVLTFLKIHNENLNIDDFLVDLAVPRDGYFQFGYLLSSTINEPLTISDDMKIVPFKEIEKDLDVSTQNEFADFFMHTSPEFKMQKDNLAMILINIPLEGMVYQDETDSYDRVKLPALFAQEKLKEIQELISLISDNAVEILVSLGSYSDHRLNYLLGLKPVKNRKYYSESSFAFFISCLATTEWKNSKEFYELILQVEHSKELKVALDRIFTSMSNNDFMGKVLDLSIAMEVMCVSGKGDNTYKVANHISWLCSQEPKERIKIMETVKNFYDLRSNIVHTGNNTLSKKAVKLYGDETKLYELVLNYVKSVLIKLLKYGKKPNWNEVAAYGGLLNP